MKGRVRKETIRRARVGVWVGWDVRIGLGH
jgi:hypothetical protein